MIFMRCFAAVIMAVQPGLGICLLGYRVVDGVFLPLLRALQIGYLGC